MANRLRFCLTEGTTRPPPPPLAGPSDPSETVPIDMWEEIDARLAVHGATLGPLAALRCTCRRLHRCLPRVEDQLKKVTTSLVPWTRRLLHRLNARPTSRPISERAVVVVDATSLLGAYRFVMISCVSGPSDRPTSICKLSGAIVGYYGCIVGNVRDRYPDYAFKENSHKVDKQRAGECPEWRNASLVRARELQHAYDRGSAWWHQFVHSTFSCTATPEEERLRVARIQQGLAWEWPSGALRTDNTITIGNECLS